MGADSCHDKFDLTGQVAIVTGGGRGIGRAMSLALAKAGAKVAVAARSEEQVAETVALIEEAEWCGLAVPTDVADQDAVERMVRQTEQHLGPVNLLVNNAAIFGPGGPMWELDAQDWWQTFDINLRGPYLCARAVLSGMVKRQRGRIITTASGAGLHGRAYSSAYDISKCAVVRFNEVLAMETKAHHISAFAILPGFVRTAMTEYIAYTPGNERWLGSWVRERIEAGQHTPPERAADLVLYLASGQADALSGCLVGINDNVPEMVKRADAIQRDKLYTLRLIT